jgi:hypothetical protein
MNSHSSSALPLLLSMAFLATVPAGAQNVFVEVQSDLAGQWMSTTGAPACLTALTLYSAVPHVNGPSALTLLAGGQPVDRAKAVYSIAAVDDQIWEFVASATLISPPPPTLFTTARAEILRIYLTTPRLSALAQTYSAIRANDRLKALSLLLSAVPSSDPDWLQIMQLFRTCYQRDRNRLFALVSAHYNRP